MGVKPKMITIDGVSKPFATWCAEHKISREAVKDRMRLKGMTFEQALKLPKFEVKKYQVRCTLPSGSKVTYRSIHDAAVCHEIRYAQLAYRIKNHGYAEFNGYRFELDKGL